MKISLNKVYSPSHLYNIVIRPHSSTFDPHATHFLSCDQEELALSNARIKLGSKPEHGLEINIVSLTGRFAVVWLEHHEPPGVHGERHIVIRGSVPGGSVTFPISGWKDKHFNLTVDATGMAYFDCAEKESWDAEGVIASFNLEITGLTHVNSDSNLISRSTPTVLKRAMSASYPPPYL